MLRGGKGEEGCHKCGQTHRQTETDVNPTSRYSTGFSIIFRSLCGDHLFSPIAYLIATFIQQTLTQTCV